MKISKLFLFLSFLLMNSIGLFGQLLDTVPFEATDREELYKQIEVVLTQFKREDCDKTLDDYKLAKKENKITDQHYQGFLKLANEMVKFKMKRYNFIQPLLSTILKFADDPTLTAKYFDSFIDLSIQILNDQNIRNPKPYEDYLIWSFQFWINNNLYKASGGSHAWNTDTRNFEVKYENKNLSVKYQNSNLFCHNKGDSLTISNSNFTFYPLKEKGGLFEVERAIVNWNMDGAKDARAELKNFKIEGRDIGYKAEEAILLYPSVFKIPMEGAFADRIAKRSQIKIVKDSISKKDEQIIITPSNLRYPRFVSKSRNINIENIGEGVNYIGGFRLEGNVVRGYGDENGRSTIIITNRKNQVVAKIVATKFDIFKGERIISSSAEVVLYIHGENGQLDSIFHPDADFNYSIIKRLIDVKRGGSKTSKVPFTNSLQKSEIHASSISWPIDKEEMKIGDNQSDMKLNSDAYFDIDKNEKYTALTTINPLVKFALYSEKMEMSMKNIKEGRCDGFSGEDEDSETMEELCARDPTQCPDWYLQQKEMEKNNPPVVDEETDIDLNDAPEIDSNVYNIPPPPVYTPRRFPANELLRLLDKRMEKLTMLSCGEYAVLKRSNRPNVKFIKTYLDWKDFDKNHPKKYKEGYINVMDVVNLTNDVMGPSHNVENGWSLILEMIGDGFVTFDYKDSMVVLKDKLFHYKNALNRSKDNEYDFDRIRFNSNASPSNEVESNAVLNLKDQSMKTNGVQSFVLSDSQNVRVEPFDQKVSLLPNKDIRFDGLMTGGMLNFTGRKFHFKYDQFQVDMDSIDFIDFFIYERAKIEDPKSRYFGFYTSKQVMNESPRGLVPSTKKVMIRNQLRNTEGFLIIDKANNKSGKRKSEPQYSIFTAESPSYVYFERDNRMNKYAERAYPQDKVYYEADPFTLESTNKYEPKDLKLNGRFYSANIFPVIEEPLRIMFLDLSLGFETETPAEGFPIYSRNNPAGKGKYTGILGMSNQGLLGRGRLDYLGASIESEYIEFMPERFIIENVDSFNLREEYVNGVEFPKVYGEKVLIEWLPYKDSMFFETDPSRNVPFKMFAKGEHLLYGSMTLTPNGLLGVGAFEWDEAKMKSNKGGDFVVGRNSVKSLTSEMEIKKLGTNKLALRNKDIAGYFDFDKKIGEFVSNNILFNTELPLVSYSTTLDKFKWDMNKQNLYMESALGTKGLFVATDPDQDTVYFMGTNSTLDIGTGKLLVDGVRSIQIADAYIFPFEEKIEIGDLGMMSEMTQARIMIDTANQNHQIQKATVDIINKNEYKATGYLEFNIENFKEQEILFADIKIGKEKDVIVTKGRGDVDEMDNFYLDPKTRFRGEVLMSGNDKNLTFTGQSKISSRYIRETEWFTINSKIDKKNAFISYDVPVNSFGDSLFVGMFLGMDSMTLYPCFLTTRQAIEDRGIFTAKGIMKYDRTNSTFMFGDSSRIISKGKMGNIFTLSDENGKVEGSGRMDFDAGFNKKGFPNFEFTNYADFNFSMERVSEYKFDMTTLLNFYLPDALTNILFQELVKNPDAVDQINYTGAKNAKLKDRLMYFVKDEKDLTKIWTRAESENIMLLPDYVKHTFFFSDLTLKWSDRTQSFIYLGNMGLSSIKGKHVGQVLKGGIELQMDPLRGDVLTFYFSSAGDQWYFFQYTNGVLTTTSASGGEYDYSAVLTALKKKDLKVKTENGGTFEIIQGNPGQYAAFKQRMQAAYK